MQEALRTGWLFVTGALILGCGSSAKQEQSRETATKSYQAGISALESRDFGGAVEHLTAALEGGWLGYSTVDAYTKRAIARAALGNYYEAHADLDKAEGGEGATLETYVARSYVLEKQGKKEEAKAVWNRARRINRRVKKLEY